MAFSTLLALSLVNSRAENVSSAQVVALILFVVSAAASGTALRLSKQASGRNLMVLCVCGSLALAALLHLLLVPFPPCQWCLGLGPGEVKLLVYAAWASPPLLAALCGLSAALSTSAISAQKHDPDNGLWGREEEDALSPSLPMFSLLAAMLVYSVLGAAGYVATSGFSPVFTSPFLITLGLAGVVCALLLAVGFSLSVSMTNGGAGAILASCAGVLLVVAVHFAVHADVGVNLLYVLAHVVLAAPVAWPMVRSSRLLSLRDTA